MEVSNGAVSRSIPSCYSGAGAGTRIGKSVSSASRVCFRGGNRIPRSVRAIGKSGNWDYGFEDKGHLDYYRVSPGFCMEGKGKGKKGWNGVSTKKKMKLLKGLTKDLSEFSELGFGVGLDCDQGLVVGDYKTKMISQAAEVLLAQLKQLRAEEEKSKKVEKQEKQKCKKQDCESSSSSSSSESSSDSECDEVVDMTRFRTQTVVQEVGTKATQLGKEQLLSLPTSSSNPSPNPEQGCCNMILEATLSENAAIEVLNSEIPIPIRNQFNTRSNIGSSSAVPQEKRIEVCMGGKCKKSGAPALMAEFQRAVGNEEAVVGCKCMGKCKSGPNVRVLNGESTDSLRTPSNPLCHGVGLEDVELIVASYFGEEKKGLGLAVAALPF